MSRDIKHDVDRNESGPGPKDEAASEEPESKGISKEPSRPLFLSNSSEGKKGNAQDEKDETPE